MTIFTEGNKRFFFNPRVKKFFFNNIRTIHTAFIVFLFYNNHTQKLREKHNSAFSYRKSTTNAHPQSYVGY